ncbi:bifunctional RNase H/acid phosphatase [Streptomyces fragilis]|uniref:Bifunctional RNase H/acid phosphatase n=1 Tax=Streptomyces fragilis TaxID=67301 RepID=A0ABV2YAU8_9ACTN|nr:bifunctional RNase H/acid phosphatase [Streptomyces fragilis]
MREFVIEADGGSRGNPGPAGYGAVVADAATGEVLAETAEYLGVTTNNVAEYSGLVAGLRAVRELAAAELAAGGEVSVRVRMDSKLVVEQMSGRWKIKHPGLAPLAEEARGVLPTGNVTYEWIPRKDNKRADRLANEAMDAGARGEAWMPSGRPAPTEKHLADLRAAAGVAAKPTAGPATETPGSGEARGSGEVPGSGEARDSAEALGSGEAPGSGEAVVREAPRQSAPQQGAGGQAAPRQGWSAPDLGAPATLVLLRHGETPLTPQKRFSGSGGTDPSLSEAGLEQARRAARLLAARGTVQAIVSSPLARTRETAAVVADRLGLDVTVDEGLRETDFGAWEGLTFAEVMERHPEDMDAWLASPDARPTGGGESFNTTAARVEEARDRLIAAHAGRTVLLVTHVTPIKTLVRLALGAPPEALFHMELSAASISAVAHYADGNASLRLFNDTSHLR